MSAVPIYRPQAQPGVADAPISERAGSKRDRIAIDWPALFTKVVVFGGLVFLSFLASSLMGQVMLEKARREGIEASARARAARAHEQVLRSRIEGMQSLKSVHQWASVHGFVAPDLQSSPAGVQNPT